MVYNRNQEIQDRKESETAMVQSIARQSVVIKCNLHASIMLGNYEFYYAAGLVHKLMGTEAVEVAQPRAMIETVHTLMDQYETEDEREHHLKRMLADYEPEDVLDEQMQALFWEGLHEERMWQE